MTRGEALAWLAQLTLQAGTLKEYTPGERLMVEVPLGTGGRVIVQGDEPDGSDTHAFAEVSFNGRTAWGYHIDPRA